MKTAGYWLIAGVLLGVSVYAGQQPGTPPAPQPGERQAPDGRSAAPPNDDFIEFLGADDVGDAAWWEFLKQSAPRSEKPRAPPPQDAMP